MSLPRRTETRRKTSMFVLRAEGSENTRIIPLSEEMSKERKRCEVA